MSSYARANVRITNEKQQKENSHEGITWSEMGKQNVQAEKVYYPEQAETKTLHNRAEYFNIISKHKFLRKKTKACNTWAFTSFMECWFQRKTGVRIV